MIRVTTGVTKIKSCKISESKFPFRNKMSLLLTFFHFIPEDCDLI